MGRSLALGSYVLASKLAGAVYDGHATDSGMDDEEVYAGVEKALRKYFGKRGEQVVQDNLTCVKRGYSEMREIPQELIQGSSGAA